MGPKWLVIPSSSFIFCITEIKTETAACQIYINFLLDWCQIHTTYQNRSERCKVSKAETITWNYQFSECHSLWDISFFSLRVQIPTFCNNMTLKESILETKFSMSILLILVVKIAVLCGILLMSAIGKKSGYLVSFWSDPPGQRQITGLSYSRTAPMHFSITYTIQLYPFHSSRPPIVSIHSLPSVPGFSSISRKVHNSSYPLASTE